MKNENHEYLSLYFQVFVCQEQCYQTGWRGHSYNNRSQQELVRKPDSSLWCDAQLLSPVNGHQRSSETNCQCRYIASPNQPPVAFWLRIPARKESKYQPWVSTSCRTWRFNCCCILKGTFLRRGRCHANIRYGPNEVNGGMWSICFLPSLAWRQ